MALFQTKSRTSRIRTLKATCPIKIARELSVELDSGTASFIESGKMQIRPPLRKYRVINDTQNANKFDFYFVGTDQTALLRSAASGASELSRHSISLVEPAKLLQGVLIDGFAVTQDENLSVSIADVVRRLLQQANLNAQGQYVLDGYHRILENTPCPEFKWNPQTTLWECLEQIGAVVDAIPAIRGDSQFGYNEVYFKYINTESTITDELLDAYSNPYGQSVDENQYNSSLGSVVENLLEE